MKKNKPAFYVDIIIRPGTLMTLIRQIFTEQKIRAHPLLRQLRSLALSIRGDLSIRFRDSYAINKEPTGTNSGHSEFARVGFSSLSILRHGAGSMSAELKPIAKRGI